MTLIEVLQSIDWTTVIVTFVGSGAIVAIVNGLFTRRKSNAEAESIENMSLSESYVKLADVASSLTNTAKTVMSIEEEQIKTMQLRLDRFEKEIIRQNVTIEEKNCEIERLQNEVEELTEQNKAKDKRIQELSNTVVKLTTRITALEKKDLDAGAG
jgi:gas vesicle protein